MMMNNTGNTNLMKTCRSCGVEKSISQYSKHSATRDKLDARCKECVRLVKKNKDRELKPRQRDEMETDEQCDDWQGGKKKGTILRKGDGLFMACVCNKKSKCFRLEQFDMDETKLRESANQFLYRTSLELGYTTNQYKIIFHPETRLPQYLLVQLSKEFVMLCDYDQLDVVKQHHLFVNMSGNKNKHRSHYVGLQDNDIESSKVVPFHKFITGYQVTDHINRYPMDNRRCNLRETSILENNRNRTNYYEPSPSKTITRNVYFDPKKEIWNVSVVMDQQIKKKSFPIQSIGYEEAKKLAHEWSHEQTEESFETHPMTGVSFYEKDAAWRSYIKIKNKMFMKSFPIVKFGFDVAKQLAIDWRLKMAQETDNFVSKPHESMTPRHPDYDRLKSEFEEIMMKHAQGWKWKDA